MLINNKKAFILPASLTVILISILTIVSLHKYSKHYIKRNYALARRTQILNDINNRAISQISALEQVELNVKEDYTRQKTEGLQQISQYPFSVLKQSISIANTDSNYEVSYILKFKKDERTKIQYPQWSLLANEYKTTNAICTEWSNDGETPLANEAVSLRTCKRLKTNLPKKVFIAGNLNLDSELSIRINDEEETTLIVLGRLSIHNKGLLVETTSNSKLVIIAAGGVFIEKIALLEEKHIPIFIHSSSANIHINQDLPLNLSMCNKSNISKTSILYIESHSKIVIANNKWDGYYFSDCKLSRDSNIWQKLVVIGKKLS